jgi:succinate dehydrogenase/fumarate reductase flavoprotein subunit
VIDVETLECDLLVIGGGMAGLSAAGWAAEHGARVIVVEKAPDIGGSAFLSGGVLWTATSPGRMQLYAGGDEALARVLWDTYPDALAWLRRREIDISPAMPVLHGRGYQIDIVAHLRGCASLVEQAGGHVVLETDTESLVLDDDGAVIGARTSHRDGAIEVRARHTLLATGGYQGSPELRERYIHHHARDMRLRANPVSIGRGLELGRSADGEVPATNPYFYGHLVSESREWGHERHFTGLSQYHSDQSLLINEQGLRFCDETVGDHTNTYQTLIQSNARALCFWDARVHAAHATRAVVSTAVPMDKMTVARENGGKGIVAASLDEIGRFADAEGFDGVVTVATIAAFNRMAHSGWEELVPSRADVCVPLDQAPFYALVVHPAITFTFGGLSIDTGGHVLRADGSRIPGLLAAGSDAGGAFGAGYAGGLALAMTFGITAARSAGWK